MQKIFIFITIAAIYSSAAYAAPADQPKSGQTVCYDATGAVVTCMNTGQDGDKLAGVAWPDQRFTPISAGTGTVITDNLTGLMWAGDPTLSTLCSSGTTTTWQGALDYVACLNTNNYLSHNDWRLPNVNELESLVHSGYNEELCAGLSCTMNAAWLNTQGFSNVQADVYWSSTTYAGSTGVAWVVIMDVGYVGVGSKSDGYYVWPVRSGQ